jgi:hypothetical protein
MYNFPAAAYYYYTTVPFMCQVFFSGVAKHISWHDTKQCGIIKERLKKNKK